MDSRGLAAVAAFTALSVGSDYALSFFPNIPDAKLVDPLVFAVAFVYGFRVGAYVGVLSELVWGTVNPLGFGGYIIPFLAGGEVIYAAAGWAASRAWGGRSSPASRSLYFGSLLALCAFVWDLETNAGTALVAFWPGLTAAKLLATEALGIPFMVSHELSDFFTGAVITPVVIRYARRERPPALEAAPRGA
ncbi:MAG: hypothetical protein JRM86_02515 [Nitrososphaerota archaeon]|nr:hypothetical protein [Nitrososphaerota archaeon]MDG6967392.1 hypothetical protein [Nitrososphaerota archaeon]MDG6977823.1 hypothetical protein [Nitrososphaerota archaeon]MDG7005788.1 hypothetical protein [Nitrososphaerota archaeon]MDG7020682.1 hypothetical protein [Nitrososphaerota archaeon]